MIESFTKSSGHEKILYLRKRLDQLKTIRQPWLNRWEEVSDYICPYAGRFRVNDHQETRNYDLIYDNEGGRALNILTSGLASCATSPVRQWFKLKTKELTKDNVDLGIAKWCSDVEEILLGIFQKSNTYNSLHMLYRDLCLFGVGVDLVYEDPDTVIRHHIIPPGEYCIQVNEQGKVDTLYREFQLTVNQAVQFFGYDKVSKDIRTLYGQGELDQYFTFCHAIEPRNARDKKSKSNKSMPYASYYFCTDDSSDDIIMESGFKQFPALCPRWDALSGETYGLSPSITALPNIKQLQIETQCKSDIVELAANPPLAVPATIHNKYARMMPGQVTYMTSTGVDQMIKPIYQTTGDINAITADIMQLKQDIRSDYFVDLFLMVQQAQDDRKTAAEIYALKEEKMLVLGSVVERLQHELLEPLVEITYAKLKEKNALPPPPQNLSGRSIELEFQSMLAQSQRAIDINNIDRFFSFTQAANGVLPEIIDNINCDKLVRVYRDRMGVDPSIIRNQDEVDKIRQERYQAQQQQMQTEQGEAQGATLNQLMQAQKAGAEASMATQNLEQVGLTQGGML